MIVTYLNELACYLSTLNKTELLGIAKLDYNIKPSNKSKSELLDEIMSIELSNMVK